MNEELRRALCDAGASSDAIQVDKVVLNREANCLSIYFVCAAPPETALRARLQERFSMLFPDLGVRLIFSAPAAEAALTEPDIAANAVAPVKSEQADTVLLGKSIRNVAPVRICDLNESERTVVICGTLVSAELKEAWAAKNADANGAGKFSRPYRVQMNITDGTDSVYCVTSFPDEDRQNTFLSAIQAAGKARKRLLVRGICRLPKYSREILVFCNDVNMADAALRIDTAAEKRVELHLHSRMSMMDGLTDVTQAFETAKRFGHAALAVTDHGVVQAFPEAAKASANTGVKAIFGVEGYLMHDTDLIETDQTFVVFDLETTGLKPESAEIIEIGAVKLRGGEILDRFQTFINDGVIVPKHITELTGIHTDMLEGAPTLREALTAFDAFTDGCCLVAHNATFDMSFIHHHGMRFGLAFDRAFTDTLMLSRNLMHDLENHKLDTVCEALGVQLTSHHRAVDDAAATADIFLRLLERMRSLHQHLLPVYRQSERNKRKEKEKGRSKQPTNHIVILAATQDGIKNLYRLVSYAHLDHFRTRPIIPLSLLSLYRDGLIIGSACEQGELYRAILRGAEDNELASITSFYDYLEIQPRGNNAFLVREGTCTEEQILDNNRKIVALGEQLNKPVVATGDVHFLEPEDAIYRQILMTKMGFSDADQQAPLFFKTTDEMLEEFAYLGAEKAREVVVTVPNELAARCAVLKPFPDGTHAPKIPDAENILRSLATSTAHEIYGDPLPEIVEARLDRELKSIIGNGFASLYLMAQRLVQKSLSDGYLVGSRGSVGSSFVATMAGITEVNPLQPHYVCPACKHSDFDTDRSRSACGVDMPDRDCPVCGHRYDKRGFDIPFEVFLGFKGDKTPDIDLNFSGEYQPVAHKYVEEMFGRGHAFRAGTISGIKEMKAYECVMSYIEQSGRVLKQAERERLIAGCLGVKVTTGQHPGGIVIVPKEEDILDFTPLQYPADKKDKNTITTHFDFHAMDDRLVKLDILGHDDPTALRMLQDLTGVNPRTIPLDDPETMRIFSSSEPLHADLSGLDCRIGSLGVPEFGTGFVRGVLENTLPSTMEELVRIAGLTHGTDVWLNNAEPLVTNKIAKLSEVICTRDDIMNYLMAHGMEASLSFKIMERVRKGKGLLPEMESAMVEGSIPAWFVDSCKKIKYMFPRGHAVAYAMMSFRIAYYKVHYPLAFYAVYFTVRADLFDVSSAHGGAEAVLLAIQALEKSASQAQDGAEKKRSRELITILEVVYEMNLRGIDLLPVDIYRSDATKFLIEDGALRPPFNAIPGVGDTASISLAGNRGDAQFLSIEDFQARTGANSAVIAAMEGCGCFDGLPRSNQISLF